MTNTKLGCIWRDGCNQHNTCQQAGCCQGLRSNREMVIPDQEYEGPLKCSNCKRPLSEHAGIVCPELPPSKEKFIALLDAYVCQVFHEPDSLSQIAQRRVAVIEAFERATLEPLSDAAKELLIDELLLASNAKSRAIREGSAADEEAADRNLLTCKKAVLVAMRAVIERAAQPPVPSLDARWIPVTERKPEPEVLVLAWDGARTFVTWFGSLRDAGCGVTHWIPYPMPPGATSDMHDGRRAVLTKAGE